MSTATSYPAKPGLGASNNDDEFSLKLKKIVADLAAAPSNVSEVGIRRLAKQHNFEVFEDNIPNGKRLSIGGTIVLLDIDFIAGRVVNVALSMASNIQPSDPKHSFMSTDCVEPSASSIVFDSLKRSRLDKFGTILGFLSKSDKLSSSIDCFRSLDEVAHALFLIHDNLPPTELDYSMGYGRPIINPGGMLGLGAWYWTKQRYVDSSNPRYHAYWGFREIPKTGFVGTSKYAVKYTQQWLQDAQFQVWNNPDPLDDAEAEFVLSLDPPVWIPGPLAKSYDAELAGEKTTTCLNPQLAQAKTGIVLPNGSSTAIHFTAANLMPYLFVKVDTIPIAHPRDLKAIFAHLRKYILLETLWKSAMAESSASSSSEAPEDFSFVDYMMEFEDAKNQSRTEEVKNITISMSLCENENKEPEIAFKLLTSPADAQQNHSLRVIIGEDAETKQMAFNVSSKDTRLQHALHKLKKALDITEDLRVIACLMNE